MSMTIKYIATTSDKLSNLPLSDGQLIYLKDINATYYDMSSSRRLMSSMRLVSALPSTAAAQEGVLYGVVNASGNVDASIWDSGTSIFRKLTGYVATTNSLGLVKPDGSTITIDANGTISCSPAATAVSYDNTSSGLTGQTVQAAIDEVNTIASGASTAVSNIQSFVAAATTALADLELRMQAVESIAAIALTTEG